MAALKECEPSMLETTLLSLEDRTETQIREIAQADILVGVPSFNNASTIGHVVKAVIAGLAKYFPDARAVLVNSDGGSTDGTPDMVAKASVDLGVMFITDQQSFLHRIITPYKGISGKGSAFRTIFGVARRLDVKACAVVDADLRSITPEWINLLLRPVLNRGFDFVAPYYLRHKYDGTITNSIVYPLTRALYGVQIRQPIGGDFGFSGELAGHYMDQHVWESDVAGFGIDIWMTTEAVASGARVCQSFLGAKIHNPKDPAADLSVMLAQVIGAIFSLMEVHQQVWIPLQGSTKPIPMFGFQYEVGVEPVNVNVDRMIASLRQGLADLRSIWEVMLAPETLRALSITEDMPAHSFHIPDEVWARTVYDCALAFHRQVLNREHLLKAMTPLYLGRTASFVVETQGLTTRETEDRIEQLGQVFEKLKPYLVERWDTAKEA